MSIKTPEIFCKPTGGKVVSGVSLSILMVFVVLTVNLRMQNQSIEDRPWRLYPCVLHSIPQFSAMQCIHFCKSSQRYTMPPCIWLSWFSNVDTLNSRTRSQSIVVFDFSRTYEAFDPGPCVWRHARKQAILPGTSVFPGAFPKIRRSRQSLVFPTTDDCHVSYRNGNPKNCLRNPQP